MKIQFLLAILLAASNLTAESDWKPKPGEVADMSDPRFEALVVYANATVAMGAYADMKAKLKSPGDEADRLVTAYQETSGAATILKPLDFLAQYPDSAVVRKLLVFQFEQTSGVWPPWKYLAIRIFRDHPEEFDKFFKILDEDQKAKLLKDVRMGFVMATDPNSMLAYRIPAEDRQAIEARIEKLEE